MPQHKISYAATSNIRQNFFIRCLDMLLWITWYPTLIYSACCGIQSWMLRHSSLLFFFHFLPSPHATTSIVTCCSMLFSYLFQCLGILSSMLLQHPLVFSLCCSIELPMPWHALPLLILAQFWSVFAPFDFDA